MLNQEQKQELNSLRHSLLCQNKFPLNINTLAELLNIWIELEEITTEKQKEKSYFVLRDKEEKFKIFFYKSGYVKKVNENNREHLFLNNWNYDYLNEWNWKDDDDFCLEIPTLEKYSLEILIDKAHKFMISKKILNNVETFFRILRDQKPKTPFG